MSLVYSLIAIIDLDEQLLDEELNTEELIDPEAPAASAVKTEEPASNVKAEPASTNVTGGGLSQAGSSGQGQGVHGLNIFNGGSGQGADAGGSGSRPRDLPEEGLVHVFWIVQSPPHMRRSRDEGHSGVTSRSQARFIGDSINHTPTEAALATYSRSNPAFLSDIMLVGSRRTLIKVATSSMYLLSYLSPQTHGIDAFSWTLMLYGCSPFLRLWKRR